jgi:hypothetical protein
VVFPICSRDGTIEVTASGTDDAALYVGNSHDIVVEHNHVTDSTAAIESHPRQRRHQERQLEYRSRRPADPKPDPHVTRT